MSINSKIEIPSGPEFDRIWEQQKENQKEYAKLFEWIKTIDPLFVEED